MTDAIDGYLDELKRELQGADPALIQDALADAHEHLANALESVCASDPTANKREELRTIVATFGTPAEIATAYREIERRVPIGLDDEVRRESKAHGFLSVYSDSRTWGSLLYMVLAFVLGTGYVMWVVLGLGISAFFSITIIGFPILRAYGLSIRGIALLEGRLVETLLGVRMPRRRIFYSRETKFPGQLRVLAKDKKFWTTLLYASSLWLIGTVYISLFFVALALSASLLAAPVVQENLGHLFVVGTESVFVPRWAYPISILAGAVLWTSFLHLARVIGNFHALFAKALFVGEE